MKTVGEFKKAGLVFVDGDTLSSMWAGNVLDIKSSAVDVVNSGLLNVYGVHSFAWRTNTGDKPSFDGVIEYRNIIGIVYTVPASSVNFSSRWDGKLVISEWRPSLNQGEQLKEVSRDEYDKGMRECVKSIAKLVGRNFPADIGYEDLPSVVDQAMGVNVESVVEPEKPTYTKAMRENNELPPVGSICLLHLACVTYKAEITYMGNGVGCFKDVNSGVEYTFSQLDAQYDSIQTEREKAINNAFEAIVFNGDVDMSDAQSVIGKLYDAGYLK